MPSVGQILINEQLPPDMRDYSRVLDKPGITRLLSDIARIHPDKYRMISHNLSNIGWRTAQEYGGDSFGIRHLRKSAYAQQLDTQLQQQINALLDNDKLDDKRREEEIIKLVGSKSKEQQDKVYAESIAEGNPLAHQVLSGARGNKMNLTSLRGSDMLYVDHRDQVIPIPVLSSYSQGLKPEEYFSGTYGARKGVIDLKMGVMDAGYLSKVMAQVVHRLVVEDLDDKAEPDLDRGLPVDTADGDNEGALLSRRVGPYARNTVLTPKILSNLQQLGHKRILVRSPIVGGSPYGGVYARDVGVREHGVLPGRGEMPAMTAVQALSEPVTQATISSKHTGGVAGESKTVSGFDYIEALIQTPRNFKGGAVHSDVDGSVTGIEAAPAGGSFVNISGTKHYVSDGLTLTAKVGDKIEAGDMISEGAPNPVKIVEHKGIGEGRRYFVDAFKSAMRNATSLRPVSSNSIRDTK